jgi:hypothetical protein
MQESVIYQDIRAEAIQEGLQQGETTIVLRQLARRVGKAKTRLSHHGPL